MEAIWEAILEIFVLIMIGIVVYIYSPSTFK